MANPGHVAKLKEGVEAWNAWRNGKLVPLKPTDASGTFDTIVDGPDLEGANLEGVDLSKANLKLARLGKAWLAEVKLRGADLQNAQLNGAVLDRASLTSSAPRSRCPGPSRC